MNYSGLLSKIADIGYNKTKRMHYYYGVKLSFFVTESGFSVNYIESATSVHDIQMVKTLVQKTPFPQIIGDKGYLSKGLKTELVQIGITITTPMRKNIVGADKVDDCLLGKRRKVIEIVFSSFESLGIQAFKSRSIRAFEFHLEMILLVYALMLEKAQQRFSNTLRYSLGRFLLTSTMNNQYYFRYLQVVSYQLNLYFCGLSPSIFLNTLLK